MNICLKAKIQLLKEEREEKLQDKKEKKIENKRKKIAKYIERDICPNCGEKIIVAAFGVHWSEWEARTDEDSTWIKHSCGFEYDSNKEWSKLYESEREE